jgi:hypothetical protein
MERIYIDNDMARFTRRDLTLVDMDLFDGRHFEKLEPRRLFPITGIKKYITLLDEEGVEVAIIRDLMTLPAEDRRIIEECLDEYYHIPKIIKVKSCEERFGVTKFYCVSNRGDCTIEVNNIIHQVKLTHGIRVLFRDNEDNRYEVPDIRKLDSKSRSILDDYL